MTYIIQGNPVGLSAPRSAFEALHGIAVTAQKVRDRVIVAKTELIAKLQEHRPIFADFWNETKADSIEFEEKDCIEKQ